VLVSSHKHLDHFYVSPDFGNPEIVIQTKEAKGISFRAFPAAHDEKGGQQRGMVNMFRFEADGITFLHPGDIGEKLSGSRIDQIGKIDVMFLPVGGFFTIGPSEAAQFAEQINPKIIIPMHYKTQKIKFPIKPVDDFLKGKKNVKYLKSSRVTIKNESLPDEREIWVMEYEL
jgi:L-ascorbate metabolism protein UlaG (beta-lactamase superfamily)